MRRENPLKNAVVPGTVGTAYVPPEIVSGAATKTLKARALEMLGEMGLATDTSTSDYVLDETIVLRHFHALAYGTNRRNERFAMLDLFSGSGSASRAAAVRGWHVHRVDNAIGTTHDERADLATWDPLGQHFDLVWASPPCTLLSTANQKTRDVEEGLVLVRAALRIIEQIKPRWWVLENVHGATRAIGDLIGPPVARYGSFYLWGNFPPFEANVPREKTKLSGRRRAERRAAIPWAISNGLIRACETLAKELE